MEVLVAKNRDSNMRRKRGWRGNRTGEEKVPAVDKTDRARVPNWRGLAGWIAVKQSARPDPVASQEKHTVKVSSCPRKNSPGYTHHSVKTGSLHLGTILGISLPKRMHSGDSLKADQ